jgi:predicted nucleic acid-binding protein
MLFDTDVLIWVQRGNRRAASLIDRTPARQISVQTYMELLQGARSRVQHQTIKDFLSECGFAVLPLSENIGHRASIYMEEYALSSGLRAGDALIAATAVEHNLVLGTANRKHFRNIRDLRLRVFRP